MTSEDILDLKLKQIENKSLSNKSAIITQAQTLEQNDDTKNEAIYMWQRVAQSSSLGDVTFVQSIYAISQLHFQLGEFDKSLSVIEDCEPFLTITHTANEVYSLGIHAQRQAYQTDAVRGAREAWSLG